jgi:hypothetical protein
MKAFRDEALKKNMTMAVRVNDEVDTNDPDWNGEDGGISKEFDAFWKTLKVGDIVYTTDYRAIDFLGDSSFEVIKVSKNGNVRFRVINDDINYSDPGDEFTQTKRQAAEMWSWVSIQKPYPLTEDNI